jgi:hypothetical protein
VRVFVEFRATAAGRALWLRRHRPRAASWIKEDFERSFYSKRAKLQVELVETVDAVPVWATNECEGYGRVLFRDLLAALNIKERKLPLAVRTGETVSDIAAAEGIVVDPGGPRPYIDTESSNSRIMAPAP